MFRALGVGRWVLGDFFPRFRGGEVPDPDETYALRLAASNPTAWLTSCRRPTDFTFGRWVLGVGWWALGVGRWVFEREYPDDGTSNSNSETGSGIPQAHIRHPEEGWPIPRRRFLGVGC